MQNDDPFKIFNQISLILRSVKYFVIAFFLLIVATIINSIAIIVLALTK